jgi:surface antigen
MRVKNGTVLGKLCLLLFLNPVYAQSPAFESQTVGIAWVMNKWFGNSLSKQDLDNHKQAVNHALNNLDNGETVTWRSIIDDADGQVRIVYTWPASGTVCRRIYSFIRINDKANSYQDTACLNTNRRTWTFVDKY